MTKCQTVSGLVSICDTVCSGLNDAVSHGGLRHDMPLPACGVAAVGQGTAADQRCRVTHVKVEEPAAPHGAHSRQVGSNSADSVDLVIQVHEVLFRRTRESTVTVR